jgi:hypothetical protein
MTSRPYPRATALAVALLGLAAALLGLTVPAALAAPAAPVAPAPANSSGGGGLDPTGPSPTTVTAATPTPTGAPVEADGNGFTLTTTAVGTYRKALSFSGNVPAADRGALLEIERQSGSGAWQRVASTPVAGDGSFSLTWRPTLSGVTSFRATLAPPADTAAAASANAPAASPAVAVTIYRDALATIYGPGFYGKHTACGEKLRPSTLGIASRTLKCGTEVSVDYDGESITVPVIDRGPFANHATWDLTAATAQALGDTETETVGVAVL